MDEQNEKRESSKESKAKIPVPLTGTDIGYRRPRPGCLRGDDFFSGEYDPVDIAIAVTGGDRILEPSDNGAGTEAIRGQPSLPLWKILWLRERKALRPKHRAVLDALLVDLRPRVAARIAGVSKDLVYDCLGKIFKERFAQCYQALRAV